MPGGRARPGRPAPAHWASVPARRRAVRSARCRANVGRGCSGGLSRSIVHQGYELAWVSAMTPMLSYLVCATPRSGSTLLCYALNETGVAGHPEEYFEALSRSGLPRRPHEYFDPHRHANIVERLAFREMPDGMAKPNPLWHPDTYDQYLAWALAEGTTPNGVFGAKLMWGYLGDFAELLRGIEGMAG